MKEFSYIFLSRQDDIATAPPPPPAGVSVRQPQPGLLRRLVLHRQGQAAHLRRHSGQHDALSQHRCVTVCVCVCVCLCVTN